MQKKDGCVATFMPRFDGPFECTAAFPETSTSTLCLPDSSKIHKTFHSFLLQLCLKNDDELLPSQALERPGPIITEDNETEYYIDKIIDEQTCRHGKQYLI